MRGTLTEVLAHFEENEPRGEFVIIVAGYDAPKKKDRNERRSQRHNNDAEEENIDND